MGSLNYKKVNLRHYINFVVMLAGKEIKIRYKKSLLGVFWIVLTPILQMLVVGIVFSNFIKIPNYFLFVFCGFILWNFFSNTISRATPSIVAERLLLQKSKFPIELIPISIVLANFYHFVISVLVFLIVATLTGELQVTNSYLFLPLSLWIILLCIGVSLLTSSLNVKYRDINFIVQSGLPLMFYATPIVYELSSAPKAIQILFALNPLTSIFELFRYSFLKNMAINQNILIANIAVTFIVLTVGLLAFKKNKDGFVDYL